MSEVRDPGAVEAYAAAWPHLKRCFLELLLLAVVWLVVSAPSGWFRHSLFGAAYDVAVLGPVGFGAMYAFLRAARGAVPEAGDLFEPFRRDYLQVVLAGLLVSVLIGIGFLLLVIPGIVALVRLAWVPYIVMDENMEAVAAVRASWERTRGYSWTILGIILLAIPILLLGLVLLGVGVIPALMWVHLASAGLYATVEPGGRAGHGGPVAPLVG